MCAAAGRGGEDWTSGPGRRRHREDTGREDCAAAAGVERGIEGGGRRLLARFGPLATATDGGGRCGGGLERGNDCCGGDDGDSIREGPRRGQRGRGALHGRRHLTAAGEVTVTEVGEAEGVSASDSSGAEAAGGGRCGGCGAGRRRRGRGLWRQEWRRPRR